MAAANETESALVPNQQAGGVLLACKAECPSIEEATAGMLVSLAGYLQMLSGLLFSFFIFTQQKSKIEPWKMDNPYTVGQIMLWQETWMVMTIIAISATFPFGIAPYFADAVSNASIVL
jgi:hypothetical protein